MSEKEAEMEAKKTAFALFFGNRGFFPATLQASAREEMTAALKGLGHETIALDAEATRYGAVETPVEGERYARFLRENQGKYGGVILCLPNFGDETGAVAALKDAGVPILVQAYPDELDKMAPDLRRDAFCGKFSIMDVFSQYEVPFTTLPPHTVHPGSDAFAANVDYFDRLCRVYSGMKEMTVGAIGARTTAFKTVRIDEVALQAHGITMETLDLSDVFARMKALSDDDAQVQQKAAQLADYTRWGSAPEAAFNSLTRLAVVLDAVIEEYGMDALALRCWSEMQAQLGISPCVLLSALNDKGLAAACEVDVGNAVTMHALKLASGNSPALLDWNNNYGDEEDKCILFHCGPVAQNMMTDKGLITDHAILANAVGEGRAWGCNTGRISPGSFTFGSMLTQHGRLCIYLGEGEFTGDSIPDDFFGCAGVARIQNLQQKLQIIGYLGHRHHTSVTPGHVADPVCEAFERYLGYEVTML
ncbi:MAG: L-fucose/L-arabinose isomerase family protein [Planctomycetota bacterium]|jgi:L-fucose isomerase-like protein